MPSLRNNPKSGGQLKRNGQHSKTDMLKVERQEFARDNLKGAFAGRQNSKSALNTKNTHESSRHSKASQRKIPKI